MLARFKWYRRLRGGYWGQITSPIFGGKKWVRIGGLNQPTPDGIWEFYPFATKRLSNNYIDEWYSVEPCWAVPLSSLLLPLVRSAQEVNHEGKYPKLDAALKPFEKIVTSHE